MSFQPLQAISAGVRVNKANTELTEARICDNLVSIITLLSVLGLHLSISTHANSVWDFLSRLVWLEGLEKLKEQAPTSSESSGLHVRYQSIEAKVAVYFLESFCVPSTKKTHFLLALSASYRCLHQYI